MKKGSGHAAFLFIKVADKIAKISKMSNQFNIKEHEAMKEVPNGARPQIGTVMKRQADDVEEMKKQLDDETASNYMVKLNVRELTQVELEIKKVKPILKNKNSLEERICKKPRYYTH